MKTIQELRKERGMTQLELANAIDVTPGAVYSWEKGRNEPKASQLRKLAQVFGVSMDDVAFEAEHAKSDA